MRIPCPHCGLRDAQEFSYLGDATLQRPQTAPAAEHSDDELTAWHDYVYLRDNPAGAHRELWYHASGCRQWLVVERDMRTHAIGEVVAARDATARGEP